jgi:uncharacterized protein YhaN
MDSATLRRHLKFSAMQLVENQALIARLEGLIAQLELYGDDTSAARQMLDQQRDRLRRYAAEWECLRKELEEGE